MPDEMNEAELKTLQGKRWPRAIWLAVLAVVVCGLVAVSFSLMSVHIASVRASTRSACIANLKQIHGAKCSWALENNKTNTAQPTASELYGSDKYIREAPACPSGGTYTLGNVGTKPRCSIKGHTL